MTNKIEVVFFPKPCPHCKEPLFRTETMSIAWSECRNRTCSFLTNQPLMKKVVANIEWVEERKPYTECYNRR